MSKSELRKQLTKDRLEAMRKYHLRRIEQRKQDKYPLKKQIEWEDDNF